MGRVGDLGRDPRRAIPVALQDAMFRQAQAEREKQARVILGSAEAEIAGKFVEAAKIYADHPAALQLRAMNTARAAASIMALGMDPRFDLSKAYWLVAGIAGVNPNEASIGS